MRIIALFLCWWASWWTLCLCTSWSLCRFRCNYTHEVDRLCIICDEMDELLICNETIFAFSQFRFNFRVNGDWWLLRFMTTVDIELKITHHASYETEEKNLRIFAKRIESLLSVIFDATVKYKTEQKKEHKFL